MKFALLGYGKMGRTVEEIVQSSKNDEIVLKISGDNLADFTAANLRKADIAIDFSTPGSAVENIYKCFEAGIPVVVGTTGWLGKLGEVKKKCTELNGTLFYSPNFSIGVNIFFEVNRKLAELMNSQPRYSVSIEEIHHTEKKDTPSGTAIKTAEIILEQLKRYVNWKLEQVANCQLPTTNSSHLPIIAKREPNVPGTHIVTYSSDVDSISIKHEAKNRHGFAEGAVLAAKWVVGKKGVFEMKDLMSNFMM